MVTILYIEDNQLNMNLVKKSLKPMRYTMLEAWNGQEGINTALAEKPDLILLDIHLPDMNGIEVAEKLRAQLQTANIPIVALTADVTQEVKEKCLDGDFDAYLMKPVRRSRLLKTIRQMLDATTPAAAAF